MGSREFVLAHLVSDWFSADGRLAPQPTWKRQHDSHQMPVHQRPAHGLHGLLQLLCLGGGAPDHHDRTVQQRSSAWSAASSTAGPRPPVTRASTTAKSWNLQVVIASSVSVRALLATTTYYNCIVFYCPTCNMPKSAVYVGYLYVTRQLCAQPAGVRFPYPALPRYADSYHPAICAL